MNTHDVKRYKIIYMHQISIVLHVTNVMLQIKISRQLTHLNVFAQKNQESNSACSKDGILLG